MKCPHCGEILPCSMCPNSGELTPEGKHYCCYCGKLVKENETERQSAPSDPSVPSASKTCGDGTR